MCRWLAYSGAPIYLEDVIIKSEHSLIDQSLEAHSGATTTNGDGFGIAWYGTRDTPGIYKDVQPAWNDSNLRALAAQIKSRMFLAHIRASTGTAVQRSNCHPFQYGNWTLVHNGTIRNFHALKRDLVLAISPDLYTHIKGTTDTEIMLYLALTFGMLDDLPAGIARMVGFVEKIGHDHGVEHPMQMTLGISDGQALYAFRYSSEGQSRTLFHSANMEAVQEIAPHLKRFSSNARAIVSEPLSDLAGAWVPIPEASFVTVLGGDVECRPFQPQLPDLSKMSI
jgi:glutamine amidotransferase